MTNKSILPPG